MILYLQHFGNGYLYKLFVINSIQLWIFFYTQAHTHTRLVFLIEDDGKFELCLHFVNTFLEGDEALWVACCDLFYRSWWGVSDFLPKIEVLYD